MLFFYKKCGSKRITGTSRNVPRSNTKLRNLIRSVADSIRYKFQNSYTANFYPMKTTGTGHYGVSAGFPCTIYGKRAVRITEKPYTPQRERLCMFYGNPAIFTDCREILYHHRVFPADISEKHLDHPVNPCKHLQCTLSKDVQWVKIISELFCLFKFKTNPNLTKRSKSLHLC